MKYSLRSLLIVVTLVAVLLGGRIEYLRRWGAFHEREAERIVEQACREQKISRVDLTVVMWLALEGDFAPSTPESPAVVSMAASDGRVIEFRRDELLALYQHRQQAAAYRKALRWPGE